MPRFRDRRAAGQRLAEMLGDVPGTNPVVLGIPRGGVVVAHEVAAALEAPLDVLVVRKLGYPGHEEAGFGAIGEQGVLVPESLARLDLGDPAYRPVGEAIDRRRAEVEERVRLYRGTRGRVPIAGRTAIVVDDGIATGYTFAAALAIAAAQRPARLVGAAPVASGEGARLASDYCDELRVVGTADRALFFAVSLYYEDFPQVSDAEVIELLGSPAEARKPPPPDG
jgi:putative phosphoribosyl transferase